ncbi:MAG: hypothetical protein AABX51_01945 [Nanoarchaeota archaeon]
MSLEKIEARGKVHFHYTRDSNYPIYSSKQIIDDISTLLSSSGITFNRVREQQKGEIIQRPAELFSAGGGLELTIYSLSGSNEAVLRIGYKAQTIEGLKRAANIIEEVSKYQPNPSMLDKKE